MSIVDEITRLTSAKTNIKAAIEAKGVTVPSSAHLDTYPSYVSAISGGGDTTAEDGLLEGTLSSYTNSRISYIREGGFYKASIPQLNFPNVTSLGASAFMLASGAVLKLPRLNYSSVSGSTACFSSARFSRVELDTIQNIPGSLFYMASISEVYAPTLVNVGSSAFQGCTSLQTVPNESGLVWAANSAFRNAGISRLQAPQLHGINPYAFAACTRLTFVSVDTGSYMSTGGLMSCSQLTTFYGPCATYIGTSFFASCSALSDVYIPTCGSIGSSAFWRCSSLSTLALPKCSWISPNAFTSCATLFSLYMLSTAVATLYLSNAFGSTPMSVSVSAVYGSIFVRQSLLSKYKSATQWIVFSSRFVGLTDAEIAALPFNQ